MQRRGVNCRHSKPIHLPESHNPTDRPSSTSDPTNCAANSKGLSLSSIKLTRIAIEPAISSASKTAAPLRCQTPLGTWVHSVEISQRHFGNAAGRLKTTIGWEILATQHLATPGASTVRDMCSQVFAPQFLEGRGVAKDKSSAGIITKTHTHFGRMAWGLATHTVLAC